MYVIKAYERLVPSRPNEISRVLHDENNAVRKFRRLSDALQYKRYLDGLKRDSAIRYEPEWWTMA